MSMMSGVVPLGVEDLALDEQLVQVRQGERARRVHELVEPVLGLEGHLAEAAHGVDLGLGDAFQPPGGVGGHGGGAVAVQGLQGGDLRAVAGDDLLGHFLLQGQHHVLHLGFQDVRRPDLPCSRPSRRRTG